MKLILSSFVVLALLLVVIPTASGISFLKPGNNSLENTELHGQSAVITLDIKFGIDEYQPLFSRTIVHPQLESISLLFYGDEVPLSEPELRVVGDGRHFRIVSILDGILIYGHQNKDLGNYKINVLFATDKGFIKFPVSTATPLDDDKVIETIVEKPKFVYQPELEINVQHDNRTFWKEEFNISVLAYDGRINPKATGFEGKLDDVGITMIISLGDEIITTLKGITEYGEWSGAHYITENLVQAGEYTIDVIASYGNQSISKSSSMFIIGTVGGSGSSNNNPTANAGSDQTTQSPITLDGSASSDPNGDVLTFSWIKTSGIDGELNDSTLELPTFTTGFTGDAVFELTVTDTTGRTSTDTVTITVIP